MRVKLIGRSAGRSVVAAAAYRASEMLRREETRETKDYRRKSGVVSTDILLPAHAPGWAGDRGKLWNAVESKENSVDARFAREIVIALPNELTPAAARALALGWAKDNLVSVGMCCDVCIHDPDPSGGNKNRHAHILCTLREFDASTKDGWLKRKNREWNERGLLKSWRATWADAQNAALANAGAIDRVDHRTLTAQAAAVADKKRGLAESLDRPPEPTMGVAVSAAERRERQRATRLGYEYKPVTRVARAVAKSRSVRSALRDALHYINNEFLTYKAARAAERLRIASKPAPERIERIEPVQKLVHIEPERIEPEPDDTPVLDM